MEIKQRHSQDRPTVKQRLESALKVLAANHEDANISISALCRIAKVNRSNLYSSHKDIVERVKKLAISRRRQSVTTPAAKTKVIRSEKHYEETISALRIICLELHLELKRERKRVEDLTKALRKRK